MMAAGSVLKGLTFKRHDQFAQNADVLGLCLVGKRVLRRGLCTGNLARGLQEYSEKVFLVTSENIVPKEELVDLKNSRGVFNRKDYTLYFWKRDLANCRKLYDLQNVTNPNERVIFRSSLAIIPIDSKKLRKRSGLKTDRPFTVNKEVTDPRSLEGSVCQIVEGTINSLEVRSYNVECIDGECVLSIPEKGITCRTLSELTANGTNCNLHPFGAGIFKAGNLVAVLGFSNDKISPVFLSKVQLSAVPEDSRAQGTGNEYIEYGLKVNNGTIYADGIFFPFMMPEDPAPRVQGMESEHIQKVNSGPSAIAEALTHPASMSCPFPKKILPKGSGSGAAASSMQPWSFPKEVPPKTPACSRCQEYAADEINYVARSGFVLVINNYIFPQRANIERTGSDDDAKNLANLFDDFGFRSRIHCNLTGVEMLRLLTDTAEKDFSRYDCFVCVILSHGSKDGIYGTDDKVINIEAITSLFRRDECPALEGKPKIFLIQACRGNQRDRIPVESDGDPAQLFSNPSLPADADFLICFSSAPGHQSYRQPSVGSWFISALFEVFMEYAEKEHIMDMMIRVNNQVAGYFSRDGLKQMPCLVSMLTKRVFFEPRFNIPTD